jgi:toxin ParE1/3/4
MKIRWPPEAADDPAHIVGHIRQDSATVARRVAKDIYDRAGALRDFPYQGRKGRVEGTRELPLTPLPFIVVYRVLEQAVEIVNIIYGAQRWE